MLLFKSYISLFALGIILIIIIDVAGSILSRKFSFNYGYFIFLSIASYTYIGFKGSLLSGLSAALILTLAMGIFDAIIGSEISVRLKANLGKHSEKILMMTLQQRLKSTLFFSLIFGFIGHLIA